MDRGRMNRQAARIADVGDVTKSCASISLRSTSRPPASSNPTAAAAIWRMLPFLKCRKIAVVFLTQGLPCR
jgi:hypothetical protein